MLARLVEQGELPAVEDRLPDSPLIVEPTEQIGAYGGAWNSVVLGVADTSWLGRTIGYETLLRWDPGWNDVVPNVAEEIEVSEDAREFVIRLRSGMKWSDGEPLTADDLIFAYEEVLLNEQLTPVLPSEFLSGGEIPAEVDKVDDWTVVVHFERPDGLFRTTRASPRLLGGDLLQPRHYLEQFHADHNVDIDELVQAEDYASWPELFLAKADMWSNSELPRLHPWVPTSDLGEGNRVVARRNPYYFKTDPDGSQLPYLDEVVFEVITESEAILLKATNGELDMQTRHVNSLENRPVLARSRDEGGYDFITLDSSWNNEFVVNLNLTHEDPAKREVFQNRDFRIGLSHAIDRVELRDTVFQRQGEPWQAAPARESQFFDEELAIQFTEFDPELAGEYLDRTDFSERDGEGFRLGPDGERIVINIEVPLEAFSPFWVDAAELIADYWNAVGVQTRTSTLDRSLFFERIESNQHDAAVWNGDSGGLKDEMFDPRYYFPSHPSGSRYAIPWAEWFTSHGSSGQEPPAAPRQQMELYWQLVETPDEETRNELFREILAIAKEQFYLIGTIRIPEGYGIVSDDLKNVPSNIPESVVYNTPGPSNPEQYYVQAT